MKSWKREDGFFRLHTPWVTFFGEHYIDDRGKRLEYYRVEKADSVIVVPLQEGADRSGEHGNGTRLLFPKNQFRPGPGRATLDFPGGRVDEELGPEASAAGILERELGIPARPGRQETVLGGSSLADGADSFPEAGQVAEISLLSPTGFLVNSSFSNQRQFTALARIPEDLTVPEEYIGSVSSLEKEDIEELLEELECAQCRLALFELLHARA